MDPGGIDDDRVHSGVVIDDHRECVARYFQMRRQRPPRGVVCREPAVAEALTGTVGKYQRGTVRRDLGNECAVQVLSYLQRSHSIRLGGDGESLFDSCSSVVPPLTHRNTCGITANGDALGAGASRVSSFHYDEPVVATELGVTEPHLGSVATANGCPSAPDDRGEVLVGVVEEQIGAVRNGLRGTHSRYQSLLRFSGELIKARRCFLPSSETRLSSC